MSKKTQSAWLSFHPGMRRAFATALATLLFWSPLASTAARAQEAAERVREKAEIEIVQEVARGQADASESAAARKVRDSVDLDWAARTLPDADKTGDEASNPDSPDSTTVEDGEPLSPLALPSGPAKTAVTPQQVALPKGEGSIEGMGESFTPNLSSGTGTYGVPIALPKGRNGVTPSLSLSYSTAGGTGVVGAGWSLAVPFISRQTDKGLPRYRDSSKWSSDEDRFMYNGGQELVPINNADGPERSGSWTPAELQGWQQYRSRIEGAFMRFFRAPDLKRWVVQSKDGTRFDFGLLPSAQGKESLQTDPENPERIFAWYLTRMSDAHGGVVQYRYTQDQAEVYLTDVYYDPPASCGVPTVAGRRDCSAAFEQYGRRVHFVYETRADKTTSYRTTFRVQMAQRLKRLEITSAQGGVGQRYLVRRYHLKYDPGAFHSLLASVQLEGRSSRYDGTLGVNIGQMVSEVQLGESVIGDLLPAMRFTYTEPVATSETIGGFGGVDATVIRAGSSPDHSVDEARADLFDVNADGLPDLLVTDPAEFEQGAGVYFNGFTSGGRTAGAGSFGPKVRVGVPPGLSGTMTLSNLNVVPMDIDGDGKSDLLHMPRQQNYGYFVTSKEYQAGQYSPVEGWSFAYIKTALPKGVTDPRIDLGKETDYIKTLDVNNDHLIDVVKTSGQRVQTWLNLGWLKGGDGRFGSYSDQKDLSTEPIESCLPFAGRTLDFSDQGVRIADMNGDGLQDIVQLGFGSISYFPGRGEGAWGVGSALCNDSNRSSRHVVMADAPRDLSTELAGVHLVDVNEDGATDLIQLSADTLSVWFNRLGEGFTDRIVVDGLPFASEVPARTRIADIDGSGTTDIIYARAGDWQWIDPMGGTRPRMLETVDNGLGSLTTLQYSTSIEDYLRDLSDSEFTWNSELLAPGALKPACDAKAEARDAGCVHRGGGTPMVSTVLRAIVTTDRMSALGVADSTTRTEFRYHDGYYEGIEQEFRGFGAADAVALGDANDPTSITRTHFHQGRRPNAIAADRLADNPNEALKGRAYLTESYDLAGQYLSTSHTTYAVRSLAAGLNGVDISYAYVKRSDELKYDTGAPASAAASGKLAMPSVVRERAGADYLSVLSAGAVEGDASHQVAIRNPKYAHIAATTDIVDNVGNLREQTALGRIDKSEAITTHTDTQRVDDASCDGTGWLWRTKASWRTGAGDQGRRLQWNESYYSACGDPVVTAAHAELPADGAFAFAGSAGTASYTQEEQLLWSSVRYDVWGQATETCVGANINESPNSACFRYSQAVRDPAYQQFAVSERIATSANAGALTLLSTSAEWDQGLDIPTKTVDANGLINEVFLDGLGRNTGTIAPNVKGCEGKRVPTARIFYDITSDASSRPLSRVHTIRELSCAGIGASMLQTHAYVDGAGRVRAMLSQGDSDPAAHTDNRGHAWLRSGLTRFTAKGNPATLHQPDFFDGSASPFDAVVRNPSPYYTESVYDAFGRPVKQYGADRSETRVRYHELSKESYDEADSDPSHVHYDTPIVSYQDGHGRDIAQRLHQRHATGGGDEFHFLFNYHRPDGALTRVVRARAPANTQRPETGYAGLTNWVERRFVFDSAGRRLASFDPDTDNRQASANASRTWRYLYSPAGDLVAVRDPRGCGQNYFYDRAGRLIGEQYVACAEAQTSVQAVAGTVPVGSVALQLTSAPQNVHVLYHFDAYPGWVGAALPAVRSGVLGRITGVTDRGQRSAAVYDDRGNEVWSARQMALLPLAASYTASGAQTGPAPVFIEGTEVARSNPFDTTRTYVRRADFNHAGRSLSEVLPVDPDFAAGAAPVVGGTVQYNGAGRTKATHLTMDGVTYPVVSNIAYERDGLVGRVTHGDGARTGRASTVSQTQYDVRRRPVRLTSLRVPKASATAQTLAAVTTVIDQRLEWDPASNLTDIFDLRPGQEWPASHRPQTTHITHDALYRVEGAYFEYTTANNQLTPSDTASDWRDTEARHRAADPMHSKAAPRVGALPATRVISLDYSHDWLANMTSWDDDGHSFYERGLGATSNGADLSPNAASPTYRPSALYLASNLDSTTPADRGGFLDVEYGAGGNVTGMTVRAQCRDVSANSCRDPGGSDPVARRNVMRTGCTCSSEQHYSYRYDEVNRLSEARRFDRVAGAWTLQTRQRSRYDGANRRTIKESQDLAAADTRLTLYVTTGAFERRGLRATDAAYVPIPGETETEYLVSGARVVWQDRDPLTPTLLDADHRMTVAVGDLIHSTSAVIDLMSGELLEATGFYPNGAREHWMDASVANANSIPLERVGFTAKEADEEVGLVYFGERYLIPRIGRWSTPDPLAIHAMGGGEGLNSYHYVSGNLLQARDPLGLCGDNKSCAGDHPDATSTGESGEATKDEVNFTNPDGASSSEAAPKSQGAPKKAPEDAKQVALDHAGSEIQKRLGARAQAGTNTQLRFKVGRDLPGGGKVEVTVDGRFSVRVGTTGARVTGSGNITAALQLAKNTGVINKAAAIRVEVSASAQEVVIDEFGLVIPRGQAQVRLGERFEASDKIRYKDGAVKGSAFEEHGIVVRVSWGPEGKTISAGGYMRSAVEWSWGNMSRRMEYSTEVVGTYEWSATPTDAAPAAGSDNPTMTLD